jgi:hypothetical protein
MFSSYMVVFKIGIGIALATRQGYRSLTEISNA